VRSAPERSRATSPSGDATEAKTIWKRRNKIKQKERVKQHLINLGVPEQVKLLSGTSEGFH